MGKLQSNIGSGFTNKICTPNDALQQKPATPSSTNSEVSKPGARRDYAAIRAGPLTIEVLDWLSLDYESEFLGNDWLSK